MPVFFCAGGDPSCTPAPRAPPLPLCALLAFLSPIPAVLAWDTLPLVLSRSVGQWPWLSSDSFCLIGICIVLL